MVAQGLIGLIVFAFTAYNAYDSHRGEEWRDRLYKVLYEWDAKRQPTEKQGGLDQKLIENNKPIITDKPMQDEIDKPRHAKSIYDLLFKPKTLIDAAAQGNIESVQTFLESGENANQFGSFGRTPLMAAAEQGHYDIVKVLLEKGANPAITRDYFDKTALHLALEKRHIQIAKLLLQHNADIDALYRGVHREQLTPLAWACQNSDLDSGKLLIELGADVNKKFGGNTALHVCAAQGNHKAAFIPIRTQC